MRIAVGCDHRGLDFKQTVVRLVQEKGHSCKDFGCFSTESVDYPDIARDVAEAVARGEFDRGILICDTGIGMSIAANKVRGIRAALCHDVFGANRARRHNDASVLCLGTARGEEQLGSILDAFLNTAFEGGRHQRRLDKVRDIENS